MPYFDMTKFKESGMGKSAFMDAVRAHSGPMLKTPEEVGRDEAEKQLHHEKIRAQSRLERLNAERDIPEDFREWAKTHGVEHLTEYVWINAYQRGFRAGLALRDADK